MITTTAFEQISTLVKQHSGIHLSGAKRQLVAGRLSKRLRHLQLSNYESYYDECIQNPVELQTMINAITTNETSFFREIKHFNFMKEYVLPNIQNRTYRVWSAAASVGAEAYSIAMVLDETLTSKNIDWHVVGTDINTEVVETASLGQYPISFSENIEKKYLKKYCLKGIGSNEGTFIINSDLKKQVSFYRANLMETVREDLGKFDLIFLRNMLIYFNNEDKKHILENVVESLKPNGYLFVGHAESVNNLSPKIKQVHSTVYKKL